MSKNVTLSAAVLIALALLVGPLLSSCQTAPAAAPTAPVSAPTAAPATAAAPTAAPAAAPAATAAPAAAAPTQPAKPAAEPIKLGVLAATSGPNAPTGQALLAGAKMAVQMVNDAGGVKSLGGAKIAIAQAETDGTPAVTGAQVERLITSEGVGAILLLDSTAGILAAIPTLERNKVPALVLVSDPSIFEKGYRYIFSMTFSSQKKGFDSADFFDFMVKKHGAPTDKIAFATRIPAYADHAKTRKVRLTELGYKDVVLDETFPSDVTDQTPLVLKMKAAGASLVFYWGIPADTIPFFKATDLQNYHPWIITSVTALTLVTRDGLGTDLAKKELTRPNVFAIGDGAYTDVYLKQPSLKAFQDAFDKANPGNKHDLARVAQAGQMVFVVARALELGGSRKGEDTASSLRKINITAGDPQLVFADVLGGFKYADNGYLDGRSMGLQFADDLSPVLQTIYPDSIASAAPRVKK